MDPVDTTCIAGLSCQLNCTADGVPSPDIVWHQNGNLVSSGNSITFSGSSSYSRRFGVIHIAKTKLSHFGDYHCMASNELVSENSDNSSAALLTVKCKLSSSLYL